MARKIKVEYVQFMDRSGKDGLTLIGQPVRRALGIKIWKELFGSNPNVIPMPSVRPRLTRIKLKKVV